MTRTWKGRLRPFHGLTATLMMILSLVFLGMTPASADPGNGQGRGQDKSTATSDHGQAKTTTTETSSPGKSDHSQGNASTQGSYNQPQPQSTADQNSGGANGKCPGGPYCSTRDGSASGNGNGGGQAKGKPCAGCVGKADNKNPKGQYPGPSDHNNGYECDGNHGIAHSNPAHTGCTSQTPPTSQPTTPSTTPPTTSEQTPGNACPGKGTMTPGNKTCTPPCEDAAAMPTGAQSCVPPCSYDASMSAGSKKCVPCPTDATMSAAAESCGTAAVGAPAVAPEPEIKGVEAFAAPGLPRAAPVQAPAHAQAAPASTGLLPAGLLPNTGAGAMLLILLVGGLVLVGIGAVTLIGRRRSAQL